MNMTVPWFDFPSILSMSLIPSEKKKKMSEKGERKTVLDLLNFNWYFFKMRQ